ncbi:MAG TPA: mechanosensitive ion channel domain-containing protein [Methanomassiliicoccales archaeon]|nr:mechanosensitive ion channel domain-containing protein [Methanomassiliicoccales archaeon]
MRTRALLIAISLALIFLSLATPLTSAQNITIFEVDSYDKEITASDGTSFDWVVFNNDTSVMIIQPSLSPSSVDYLEINISPAYQTITPQNSTTFTVSIDAYREMPNSEIKFTIFFNATIMDSPESQITITKEFDLKVKALYGTTAGNNKIFGIWDNPFPPPLDTTYGAFLITVLCWIAIAFFIILVVDPIVHRITRNTETDLDDRILKMMRGPVFFIILLYGFTSSLKILNLPSDILLAIEDVYAIGLIILLIWLSYKIYDNVLISYAHSFSNKTETDLDDTLVPLFEKLGMIIIPFIGVMLIFNHFGYDLTVFIAGFGVLGIIIGFAAQDTLSNFFSGMSILLDRPFKVGDLILYEDDVCEVKRIGMRSTTLYNTFLSEYFIIPNNEMASRKITNIVKPDLRYKVKIDVGVAYGSNIELVKRLIMESALEEPHVLKDSEHYPWIRFTEFADSALVFKLFMWVDDLNNQWLAASNVRENIDRKFREHDVNIPFPQRTVWFHNETGEN